MHALGRALLWVTEKPGMHSFVTRSRLTRPVVDRFVAGSVLEDAVDAIRELNSKNIGGILDHLGEGVADLSGADAAASDYLAAVKRIEETGIDTTVSVKPTQLGLTLDKGACIDHLRQIAAEADAVGVGVEIDMEQSEYVSDTLDLYQLLQPDFPTLRLAIQACLRRTPVDLQSMAALSPKVRLVKGAYAEPSGVAFQKTREIDAQYAWLTDWLFDHGTDPAIASHDDTLIRHARDAATARGVSLGAFEIQMLYGIREGRQQELAAQGHRVRVYVPYGSAWYPYLTRRLAERPANLRFFLRAVVRG
jgi:proline dehydrogenase